MDIFTIVVLALSGLLLFVVGLSRLINPIKTYQRNSGIELPSDANLLNEIRGVSGVMLLGGLGIALGTVFSSVMQISHCLAILLFLGFALGRITSMIVDGKPHKLLIQGLLFEVLFGLGNVVCLLLV